MTYSTLSDDDKLLQIAEAAIGREREAWHYELNATNYASMLADLPELEWPPELAHLRGMTRDQIMPHITDDQVDLVSDLCLADWLRVSLRAERFEARKVNRVRDCLLSRLPVHRRDELIARAKAAMERRDEQARLGMTVTLQLPDDFREPMRLEHADVRPS